MQALFNFLSNTPLYVYFLLIYLVVVGFRASKNRIVSLNRTIIVAAIISYLAISNIVKVQLSSSLYILLSGVIVSCCALGWFLSKNKNILVDKKRKLLALPGSWLTMVVVLLIFFSKYYLGYHNYSDPSYMLSLEAKLITIYVSGFSFGLIFGRFINYIYRFIFDKSSELA